MISAEEADQALSKVRQNLWLLELRVQQLQALMEGFNSRVPPQAQATPAISGSVPNVRPSLALVTSAQSGLIESLCKKLECQLPDLGRMSKGEASKWIERHLALRKELYGY